VTDRHAPSRRTTHERKGDRMKKLVVFMLAMVLTGGLAWADGELNPSGLQWDPNSESDLAGYYVYEAQTSGGQVIGTYMVSVPAPLTEFTFPAGHADGTYYWRITAVDTAGNESGFSNEVWASFNRLPPAPPTGCTIVP
jgi:hypothetical protein